MTQNNYDQRGSTVLSNKNTKNVNFLFIVDMLKDLLAQKLITEKEYARAKKYYMKLTGADIVLAHREMAPGSRFPILQVADLGLMKTVKCFVARFKMALAETSSFRIIALKLFGSR